MATVKFLADNVEDGDYNQYWYSEKTIDKIVEALIANGGRIAFLSTPSLYFSLPDEIRSKSFVFDVSKEYICTRSPLTLLGIQLFILRSSISLESINVTTV